MGLKLGHLKVAEVEKTLYWKIKLLIGSVLYANSQFMMNWAYCPMSGCFYFCIRKCVFLWAFKIVMEDFYALMVMKFAWKKSAVRRNLKSKHISSLIHLRFPFSFGISSLNDLLYFLGSLNHCAKITVMRAGFMKLQAWLICYMDALSYQEHQLFSMAFFLFSVSLATSQMLALLCSESKTNSRAKG